MAGAGSRSRLSSMLWLHSASVTAMGTTCQVYM